MNVDECAFFLKSYAPNMHLLGKTTRTLIAVLHALHLSRYSDNKSYTNKLNNNVVIF
jgi:hypothetical protein